MLKQREIFQGRYVSGPTVRPHYDVTGDGQRFLMLQAETGDSAAARPRIRIVLNWFDELERLVPTEN